MLDVKRISHATFETPDLEREVDYYTNILGLSLSGRDRDRAFLSTTMGQPALVLEKGDAARCTKIGFQIAPGTDLAEIGGRLGQAGIRAERRNDAAPGISSVLSFADPKGTVLEIFADAELGPEDRTPKAFLPLKLGHLAFKVLDIQEIVKFYVEVLGFRVSDWRQDFFVFLRCGPDHHSVNFATADKVKMHHVAFELKDWAEMLRACDFLGRNKFQLLWGPGRHVIGDNIFTYHRDPDGHIIELYTEMAKIEHDELGQFAMRPWREDRPYRPTVWGAETLGNLWGPGPLPGFAS